MPNNIKNQGGFALVITLLLMVSISLIGLLALMNASTETLISRNEKEGKIAFQLAEGGLNEAYARMHLSATGAGNTYYIGEKTSDAGYRTVGSVNGTTGDYLAGWATNGSKDLGYGKTNASRSGLSSSSTSTGYYSVTIRYFVENSTDSFCKSSCNDEIVLYGQDFLFPSTMSPRPPSTGRYPVYKIASTGTYGNTSVSLYSYIPSIGLNVDPETAVYSVGDVTGNGGYSLSGNGTSAVKTCGTYTDNGGAANSANDNLTSGGASNGVSPCADMSTFIGYTFAELWNMAGARVDGGAVFTAADVAAWGTDNIVVIDNDGNGQQSSSLDSSDARISGNSTGSGIVIVSGDLDVSGTLNWTGLLYVYGDLKGTGTVNVTGATMAGGTTDFSGDLNVDYDQDVLNNMGRKSSTSGIIRWSRQ